LTGTVQQPYPPTSSGLEIDYAGLNDYKTVSDTIIYNPAQFKPLFGAKADPSLQARFQVVKNPSVGITDNEIKTQVIAAINNYFDPSNWDFGDTFYFSELAAYLHATLAPNISSVVIVPSSTDLVFGNYFQINAEPWEIITSAATVNDIDVVTAVTAAQLGMSGINFGSTQ
jgi:TFIIF-interacting CTD phosphatase-like protein